ncbi:P-loop containing nucleoside triphosphate hydrolase protein [Tirmania nivea]|nr:P-loop containing nucleoside triphosphate hydrolase protein [Tirmania nivea]
MEEGSCEDFSLVGEEDRVSTSTVAIERVSSVLPTEWALGPLLCTSAGLVSRGDRETRTATVTVIYEAHVSCTAAMDIFKLLSRSSGLQPRRSKPSAPASAPVNAKASAGPSKKRRTNASTNTTIALSALALTESPPELDFFGSSTVSTGKAIATPSHSSSRKRKRRTNSAGDEDRLSSSSSDEDGDGDEEEYESLLDLPPPPLPTPSESHKLAKEHKLKLTLMNPPPPPPLSSSDKKKRENSSKKSKSEPEPELVKKSKLIDTPPPTLLTSFTQLRAAPYSLSKRLYRNLLSQGYDTPTPVQMASIPLLLLGHEYTPSSSFDEPQSTTHIRAEKSINLLTCAQTGSGKTMAYLLPLLDWILWKRGKLKKEGKPKAGTKAIIVAPTRELVGQIYNEGLKLAIGTGVRVTVLKRNVVGKIKKVKKLLEDREAKGEEETEDEDDDGGVDLPKTEELTAHPTSTGRRVKSDIVVTTPTMLVHAIKNSIIDLTTIHRLILDEADVLLERNETGGGFGEDTLSAWEVLKSASSDIRVSMWSATISSSVEALAASMIISTNPTAAPPPLLRLLTGLKNTSLPHITHRLTYASTETGKLLALRTLLTTSFPPPALIFLQTVPRATALYREIQYDLPPGRIALLHAQLPDNERERVMDSFRKGEVWALITTDLLSRGVDWRGVKLVLNYDVPGSAAAYIHRAGRTGRGGREGGEVVTFWTSGDAKVVRPIAEVVAQAERERERLLGGNRKKDGGKDRGEPKEGSARWLLDFLPKVKKEEKKRLKKFGVESRNARRVVVVKGAGDNREKVKGREEANREGTHGISTVSGWEKQRANRLRGAREASKRRKQEKEGGSESESESESESGSVERDGEEFTGFD